MVKFTKGMWTLSEDTVINWATEVVKGEAKKESIRAVAVRTSKSPVLKLSV
jgi:alpha-D-xyloside xylohydrolase